MSATFPAKLIIKAALTGRGVVGHQALQIGCNNMGVVRHGNSPLRPMQERQPQADVLRYYKGLMASSRIKGKMEHVYGHSDEYLSEAEMSHDQQINCRTDKLAMLALVAAVHTNQFIKSIFPSERVCVEISGTRVTGSPKSVITELWGEEEAQKLFNRWGVVKAVDFPFVYWEGMEKVMKSFPEMFRVWVTKQVSHFQGTNRQLSRIDRRILILNVCPSCECPDEATSHITRCRDSGGTRVFTESVLDLVQWMRVQQTLGEIIYLFQAYLLARGTRTMMSLLRSGSKLGVEAKYHDRLRWDSFLEGRVCALWVECRSAHIRSEKQIRSADLWARGLMRRLLQITHEQWIYRNATVHLKVSDGLTVAQHETILTTMEGYLHTDPAQLLEENSHLLYSNFVALAEGPMKDGVEWISEIESTLGAAEHVARGSRQAIRTRYCVRKHPRVQKEYESVIVDAEGSMKWQRRRKRQ